MIRTENREKINSLQILRAMAFLGIFLSHCSIKSEIGNLGDWGVSVFLVLSGFLMAYNYLGTEIGCGFRNQLLFSAKRLKKLYPLHILMMIPAFFLVSSNPFLNVSSSRAKLSLSLKIMENILLLQSWVPNAKHYFSLNSVAWYLSVAAFIYFVFPIILKNLNRGQGQFALRLLIGSVIVQVFGAILSYKLKVPSDLLPLVTIDNFHKFITYICPLFRLGDFCIGCCLGFFFCQHETTIDQTMATILELVAIYLIVMTRLVISAKKAEMFRYELYTPSSVFLVWVFAVNKGVVSLKLSTFKPLVFLGNISGYMFLVHQIVIRSLNRKQIYQLLGFETTIPPWPKAAISLGLTILFVWLYLKLRERCFHISRNKTER